MDHHHFAKHALDMLAWLGALVSVVSQIAQLLSPILSATSATLAIVWFIVRMIDRARGQKTNGDSL